MLAVGWTHPLPAQQPIDEPGVATLQDFSGSMSFTNDGGSYLLFQKMAGDSAGVDDGYTRIGARAKLFERGNGHLFGEVHGVITDGARFGGNAGGGYRWLMGDSLLGINGWYDSYETGRSNRYQQAGIGAEYLSPLLDLRGNAYLPFSNNDNYLGVILDPGTDVLFFGNNIGTVGTGLYEVAQRGFDFEAGTAVPMIDWLRAYAGVYYFDTKHTDVTGFSTRAEARLGQDLNLNVRMTNDSMFGTNVTLDVEVRFNGRMPTRFPNAYDTYARRYDQVRRSWAVHTTTEGQKNINVPLINPDTLSPWLITWVDNTNPGGTGTFEDPHGTLQNAPGHDLILVRAGAGSTTGNVVLENNQQLLGEGFANFIDTDRLGVIQLPVLQPDGTPGFADTGARPVLAGDAGAPVVTLANNNRVISFDFDRAGNTERAIFGSGITDFHLQNLGGSTGAGFEIDSASGSGTVTNIGVTVDAGAGNAGLAILNDTGSPLTLGVTDFTSAGGDYGLALTNTGAGSTMTVTGSTIDVSGTDVAGLLIDSTDNAFNGTFTDTTASDNNASGVVVMLDNATGSTTFTNLTASNNGTAGVGDGLNVDMTNGTNYTLTVAGTNSLTGNEDDNIDINLDSSTGTVTLSNVTATGSVAGNGLKVSTSDTLATGTAVLGLNLNTVALDSAGADAINASAADGSTLNITADAVSGSSAGDDGISLTNTGSTLNLQMTNTGSFAGAGVPGVSGNGINSTNTGNGGTTTINIAGVGGAAVDFSGAGLDGLFSSTGLNSITDIDFGTGAMFDGAGANAIHLEADDAASVTLDGSGVSGSSAGANGILINANNSAGVASTGVDVNLTNTGSFAGAGAGGAGDGLQFNGTQGADLNINIAGTALAIADFSGAADNGVNGTLNDSVGVLNLGYTNFNDAVAGDGMVVNASNNSTFTGDITNSSFNNAAVNGITANMNGSVGTLDLTNVTATGAIAGHGLNVSAVDTAPTGTSSLTLNLDNVALDNALAGNAVNALSANGATLDFNGVDVSGSGAGASAINLVAQTGSQLDFNLGVLNNVTNDFTDSIGDGLTFDATGSSTINLDVANTNFDDDPLNVALMGNGLLGSATDSTVTLNLQNVTFNNADGMGVSLTADNSSITTGANSIANVEADNAGVNAFEILSSNNSTVNLTLNTFSGVDAGVDAVHIDAASGSNIDLAITSFTGTGAGQGGVDGDGFEIIADGLNTDVNVVITNSDFSDAFNNGLEINFQNSANVVFNGTGGGVSFDNAGQSAAVPGQGDGINLFGDTLATADVHITSGSVLNAFDDQTDVTLAGGSVGTVVIDPTPATGAGDNGVEFNVSGGSTFNYTAGDAGATSADSPVSTDTDPVGNNGVLGTLNNGIANLTFNWSDISTNGSSTGSGINVTGTNASQFNLDLNNSNVTGWANGNGIIVAMEDSNATLNLNGADVSDAGDDAISVASTTGPSILQAGSTVNLNLGNGANLNDAGSSALFLSANGTGSSLIVTGDATTGDDSGDDAVQVLTNNGATASLTLTSVTGATSFQNAGQVNLGGSGLNLSAANGSGIIANVSGVTGTPVNFDNAYNFGVNGLATSGSSIQLTLDEFTASNAGTATGGGGINLEANGTGSSITNSSITNGVIQDSGDNTVDGSFGIRVTAANGANIGTQMTSTAGIDFSNLTVGNSDSANMTQDHGVVLNASNDSYLGATFTDVDLDFNQKGGFVANVNNGGTYVDDTSLLEFTYTGGSISNNGGDGVELNATDGENLLLPVQSSGINAGFKDTAIRFNANSFAQPVDENTVFLPDDPDSIGYGIVLNANDNMITITYDNLDLSNNEEGAVFANATNGGIIVQNFANMTLNDSVVICADGPGSFAAASLNSVIIEDLTGDNAAIAMCALNGGQSVGDFTNVTIRNVEAQAFAFISDGDDGLGTGSSLTATFNGLTIDNVGHGTPGVTTAGPAPFNGLTLDALIQGQVSDNATANIVMSGVTITDTVPGSITNVNAMDIDVTGGGQLELLLDGFTVANGATSAQTTEGEIDLTVDGMGTLASSGTFDLSNITLNNSNAIGLNITSDATGLLNFVDLDTNSVLMDNISANNAAEQGLVISGNLNTPLAISNSNFNGAGAAGIEITSAMNANLDVSLTNVNARDAAGLGIDLNLGGRTGDTAVSLTSVDADNTGGAFAGGGINIDLTGVSGGMQTIDLDAVTAQNAQLGDGLNINVTGLGNGDNADVSITGTNGTNNFSGAAGDGVNILLNGGAGSTGSVHVADVIANDVGLKGVDVRATGGITVDMGSSFNNITATGAGEEGLNITSDLNSTITAIRGTNNNFDGAGVNGVFNGINIDIAAQTAPIEIELTDTHANNATGIGVDLNLGTITGNSIINLTNVDATNAGLEGLNLVSDSDSTAVTITGGALPGGVSDFSGAGQGGGMNDGINIQLNAQTDSSISMTNVAANNATGIGIDLNIDNNSQGGTTHSITLDNVDATGALGGGGLDIDITNLGLNNTSNITVGATAVGAVSDFSGAFNDGVNINTAGDSTTTVNLSIDGVTASNSVNGNGFVFGATNGETVNINDFANLTTNGNKLVGIDTQFDNGAMVTFGVGAFTNVSSTGNQQHGWNLDVAGGSTLSPVTIDGLNLSNNGVSGAGFNGLNLRVHDTGSTADMTFNNLTINTTGGRALDINVYDDGDLTFNVNGGTITNAGLEGVNINVGSLDVFDGLGTLTNISDATFTGSFTGLNVSNSGQSAGFQANGFDVNVGEAGTVADITFDNTSSNSNDGTGFEVLVDNGADLTLNVNNGTTANTNATRGFRVRARDTGGFGTTLDLNSASGLAGDNTFNGNLGGPGFEVVLTDAVQVDDLQVNASANNNVGDGVRIVANDNSGVGINNFSVAGSALTVNNNTGNGLFIDFNNVGGISDFALSNATVSGNNLDQIHVRMANMTLTDFFLQNLNTIGKVGSGDGIEVNLLDTEITGTSTNGVLGGFVVDNVTSTNNGGRGLNLQVDEALPANAAITSGIAGGVITNSQFSGNGTAGVGMTFQGEGVHNFDIFDNTGGSKGFNNNTGRGLFVEVQDTATFRIVGTNLFDPSAQSFYNNALSGNGLYGFHLVASENGPYVANASGPRVDLELGDILLNPNVLNGNREAAMAIELRHDSVGSFSMVNSTLTGTINGPTPTNFNGDGLAFRLENNAQLESLTIDATAAGVNLNNNAGSGLFTSINGTSRLGTLSRMEVINTTFTGNGQHGINIVRNDSALYGPNALNNQVIIGGAGAGNTFTSNTGNGVNIQHANSAGGPVPFSVLITENIFSGNQDGIFMQGGGNAQYIGNITDNEFNNQIRDGIHFQLENDAALGDPDDVGSTPFMLAGNQIASSNRHGIFFDTNFVNESGLFSGGAFVNAEITGGTKFSRTLISASGQNGIQIIDNSDNFGSIAAAQNTYYIHATDIWNNTGDGINMAVGLLSAINENNGVALLVGDSSVLTNDDVTIIGNRDDGIDLRINDGDNITNSFIVNRTTIQGNGANGDGEGGNGIEVDITGAGRMTTLLENVDILSNIGDGIDWDISSNRTGGIDTLAVTTMFAVNSSENGGRGLDVRLRSSSLEADTSIWNIGRGDRATDVTATNRFNQNDREGVVFDLQTTALDQNTTTTAPDSTAGNQGDNNVDVYVEGNLSVAETNPTQFRPSTAHPFVGNGTSGGGIIQETRIRLGATVNFINNEATNNGTNFEDGLDLGVGAGTKLNAQIAGNLFGGNIGDDIRIYGQVSNGTNPPNSIRDSAGGTDEGYIVYDPVAYMDLILGSVDTDLDGFVDATLGNVSPDGNISVHTFGTAQTSQITASGVFTNADPVKGSNRSVVLAGQVQVAGTFDDESVNDFFQNGSQQTIDPLFTLWIQNGITVFPDPTFP